ncbi:carbohydrate ABC transporter permease [uncultured Clostridium sp.]|uniref:carbohydrate ABC transporter permease n=1 Tax=uncultured Clostridium sp. TaxID=59620 RepID=UPI0025FAE331|nr:sugar ABC transporter permease [uncultured Clostridium sp.]
MAKSKKKLSKGNRVGYAFVLPALIFMLALVGFPIIYNFVLSFYNMDVMTMGQHTEKFVGFQNYIDLFQVPTTKTSIINTIVFTVGSIIFQFILGFLLAILFHQDFKLAKPLRGVLLISWMIPVTVTALLFKFMLSSSGGVINTILVYLHIIPKPLDFLVSSDLAMPSVIGINIWIGIPFNMVLLTTGLSNIPESYYEAAAIDGANAVQRFFKITLPLMKASMLSVIILGVIYTFKVFDLIWVGTGGGPVDATEVLSTYAYRLSFTQYSFSKGAATANILFVMLLVVGIIYIKLIGKDEVMN